MSSEPELIASLRRIRPGQLVAALGAAIALGIGAGALLHSGQHARAGSASPPPGPGLYGQATWPAGAAPAPPIGGLRDESGRRFSLSLLRGRTVAVAFLDSHCNQACPLEGRALAVSITALAASERPALVIVSVNPLDTPASTRAAARRWGFAHMASWHWLRGSRAELARVWHAYHIFVAPPARGNVVHTEAVYLLDRRGDERSGYLYPFATRFVSSDLRVLARSGSSGAHRA